jgi:methionyl-tRNA formyltransferase
MTTAVVFAYHNVGVRCLKVLIAQGINVKLVITHEDNPNENIWFDSVKQTAKDYDLSVITPEDPNTKEIEDKIIALAPDFIFSFYYRQMIKAPLLAIAKYGAFNMHGSLLPKYRGRVPINWALINGETETGATLHIMDIKPDRGPIVDQVAVPILPDDTAPELFTKVVVAAELCLARALPKLVNDTATFTQQNDKDASYFGGRKAEDGCINWQSPARTIHNLVRAVTKPYPGAFSDLPNEQRLVIWRTRCLDHNKSNTSVVTPTIFVRDQHIIIRAADGNELVILDAQIDDSPLTCDNFADHFGNNEYPLK